MGERPLQARWLALLAAAGVAIYLCWSMLQPFLDVLAWATVLVIIFYPLHHRLVERTGRPGLSAMLSCLIVIATVLIPLTLVSIAVYNELSGIAQNLQANVASLLDPNSPVTGRYLQWLERYVDVERFRSQEFVVERLRSMSGAIAGRTLGLVGGLVGTIVQIVFVIFTMFYLFRDGNRIVLALRGALPLERTQSDEIFARTRDVISASIYGVLVIATIQGILGGLAFWVLGLPSPLVWGVLMLLLSMIPMAGAFIVWVPAAIFLAMTGHVPKAILLTVWGAGVIGTIDNFLRPKLVGEKTRLHELLIFFSVLGGLQVFGVLGIVLGPVVVAVTLALFDIIRHLDHPAASAPPELTLTEKQEDVRNKGEAGVIATGEAG